ncbi:acetyl-CoA C-acetyltransferase [Micrococcus cohnii]|uniref:Probable acetyl-CoA acetyltransferase n=1 Tax=Micrococcus cohnii TaxID=993416 RepID=A0A7W7GPX0_9MICC|nr:acetyl-CoA C-acyltransferase [Micrococcus cohnii]MBB4736031.1 acetyl-CoA C-acetyltransferase [Micrococcus cohnii]
MILPQNLWITAAARTPITARSRAQAHLGAGELAASVVGRLGSGPRSSEAPAAVVLGNCTGPGGNLGRIAALGAGLGEPVPGWTVDAQCGSGLLAVLQAAQHASLTGASCVGGGVESPSTAPTRSIGGVPYAQAPMVPVGWHDPGMTAAADALALQRGIGRERQERFAARSHALAVSSETRLDGDDGPRRLDARALARFTAVRAEAEPATAVTGATAARIADGAAAVRAEPDHSRPSVGAAALGRPCRVVAGALTGGDPALPGLAPVAAVRRVLGQTGFGLEDLAVIEVVEAYAAQALATLDELGLAGEPGGAPEGVVAEADAGAGDRAAPSPRPGPRFDAWGVDPRVNAGGGALAFGHPWGASGAVAVVHAVRRLQGEPPGSRALVTCAVAGGMGVALLLEVG